MYRSPSIEGQLSSVYGQLKLDGIEKKVSWVGKTLQILEEEWKEVNRKKCTVGNSQKVVKINGITY